MRTNIDIDDDIMQAAMRGSEFKTKREAVEAGLKLLAQRAHYREVLKWEGKLHWNDQPDASPVPSNVVMEDIKPYGIARMPPANSSRLPAQAKSRASAGAKKKAAA